MSDEIELICFRIISELYICQFFLMKNINNTKNHTQWIGLFFTLRII